MFLLAKIVLSDKTETKKMLFFDKTEMYNHSVLDKTETLFLLSPPLACMCCA